MTAMVRIWSPYSTMVHSPASSGEGKVKERTCVIMCHDLTDPGPCPPPPHSPQCALP